MQLWTFQRYQRPCLAVDAIELEESSAAVRLVQGDQTYLLGFDDRAAASQIAQDLSSLRDSASPLWDTLREADPDHGWWAMGAFLDSRALIRESADAASQHLTARVQHIEDHIKGTASAVLSDLSTTRRALAARYAQEVLATVRRMGQLGFMADGDPFDADTEPNFYLALLNGEFEYFRRASPLTVRAAESLLMRLAGEADATIGLSDEVLEAVALYDLQDLEGHLWLVGQALVAATGEDARRFQTPPVPQSPLCSGLEFMRQIEVLTRTALKDWGENPYVSALDALNNTYSPLVAGPFIEQYHVTRRFVEIIAPLLSKRLSAPLRAMMFQYYSEEVGHEALESTTCEALGISQRALDRALPLPLHFAFVDILTLVAQLDPVASFASIMVIEGVFGEPPKMSLRLAAVARTNPAFQDIAGDHDELNEDLNHNSISRDAFEHIAGAPKATQDRVIRRILFLLELNHRAWGGIAAFYGRQTELWLQGSLGQRLSPEGVLAR